MKHLLEIPKFSTEDEEFEFWAVHDTDDYVDLSNLKEVSFPNLRSAKGLIPVVLDDASANELEELASEHAVDLPTLAARYIQEGMRREGHHAGR